MIIKKAVGNIGDLDIYEKDVDWLELEWEELNKKILQKQTERGRDIAISLEDNHSLHYDDVLYEDEKTLIAVRTKLEKVFVIKPKSMQEMGKVAFEIGNRHTPCIITNDEIVTRYDHTLEKLLNEVGVSYEQAERRFTEPFKYRGHSH